jgi:hypothetical protein
VVQSESGSAEQIPIRTKTPEAACVDLGALSSVAAAWFTRVLVKARMAILCELKEKVAICDIFTFRALALAILTP